MKKLMSISLLSLLPLSGLALTDNLTDEQAFELGMTPIEEKSLTLKSARGASPAKKEFVFQDSYLDLAKIVVVINKGVRSEDNHDGQTLKVYQDGVYLYEFDTSTGKESIVTATSGRKYRATTHTGIYRPTRAYKEYQSYTFRGARMDYAVFFNGGIAIHSTSQGNYKKLGQRASGGCARLKLEDAMTVNEIIRSTGEGHDKMSVSNYKGMMRNLYIDRIKLPYYFVNSGELNNNKVDWTYDAAIVVVDRI
jgi:hypothetical protein